MERHYEQVFPRELFNFLYNNFQKEEKDNIKI